MSAQHRFKGGEFENRYKIVGKLTTESPLHIGDGQMMPDQARVPTVDKDGNPTKFNTVATDYTGFAHIPGSTLKGNLRAWLSQIFSAAPFNNLAHANTGQRASDLQTAWRKLHDEDPSNNKQQAKKEIKKKMGQLEYLFGSTVNEGKLEFWDAPMSTPPSLQAGHSALAYCGYSQARGTIVLKSVAIDPVSGTAAKNKLFNYEVVPPGGSFTLTVAGQNLSPAELGMLLFALEGFKSKIYPVTLGAMAGIGFGRCRFDVTSVHLLDAAGIETWVQAATLNGHAGYTAIPALNPAQQAKKIQDFKDQFLKMIKGDPS